MKTLLLLRTLAPCLLMALLAHRVPLASCRSQGSSNKTATAAVGRGKFPHEGKMQCTWVARDVAEKVTLAVRCEDREARVRGGVTDLRCEYNAEPRGCPGYLRDRRGFWKQVGRALKKLRGRVCRDERALVRAGMCRRAPRDAHFKLDIRSSVASAQSGGEEVATPPPTLAHRTTTTAAPVRATACAGSRRKTAEEYCSSSWASLCDFFFSILQSDEC